MTSLCSQFAFRYALHCLLSQIMEILFTIPAKCKMWPFAHLYLPILDNPFYCLDLRNSRQFLHIRRPEASFKHQSSCIIHSPKGCWCGRLSPGNAACYFPSVYYSASTREIHPGGCFNECKSYCVSFLSSFKYSLKHLIKWDSCALY